ncbi:hypothetical protein [Priestia megaterium]|uniref:hypothetical protein n=1 Tax=Priestia megaterium TaxID=1404 RepID=UPI003670930B
MNHEFPHKGQLVSKLQMMRYEPPNTDILGKKEKAHQLMSMGYSSILFFKFIR